MTIIPKIQHNLSKKKISRNALRVIDRLEQSGFDAYIVGGGVRDLLAGKHPKDFDIATNASPNQIKKLFKRCFLIGRRFRLAHIYFGKHFIEVATFRSDHSNAKPHQAYSRDHLIIRDNVYGSIQEDAKRRDFTINALYYDTKKNTILDFSTGFPDIINEKVKMLGNPEIRYQEDPVRMLRAIRFSAKLGFEMTQDTASPIRQFNHLLKNVSPFRLYDETIKLFSSEGGDRIFFMLEEYMLLSHLLPLTAQSIIETPELTRPLILEMLHSTNKRIKAKKSISIIFIFATLLWYPFISLVDTFENEECDPFENAIKTILFQQSKHMTLPRKIMENMSKIWRLQFQLETLFPNQIYSTVNHPRFRAAYDLLLLRSKTEKHLSSTATWWTKFQKIGRKKQDEMIKKITSSSIVPEI